MQAVNRIHRELTEQSIPDHDLCSAFRFLGRLKDKVDRAFKIQTVRVFRQIAGRAQQDGGVSIMTAGVHLAAAP